MSLKAGQPGMASCSPTTNKSSFDSRRESLRKIVELEDVRIEDNQRFSTRLDDDEIKMVRSTSVGTRSDDPNVVNQERNLMSPNVHCGARQKERKTRRNCCGKHLILSLLTVTNVLIILFILQGLLGVSSAFILLYSSGDKLVTKNRHFHQYQMQLYIDGELDRFISTIDSMVRHLTRLISRINLNDDISLIKALDAIDSLYKVGATAYRWARFDDWYLAREYNSTVKGLGLRVYNPIPKSSFSYYKISKQEMSSFPSVMSKQSIIDFLQARFSPFFYQNSTYHPKDRAYYLPFVQSANSTAATDTMWTELWVNYESVSVISLGIPLFSNYSNAYFYQPENSFLLTNLLHPKLISIPYVNVTQFPEYKKTENLFGVISIQFTLEIAIATLLNASSTQNSDIFKNSFIINSKGTIIGTKGTSTLLKVMHHQIITKNILDVLSSYRCINTNSTSIKVDESLSLSVTGLNTYSFTIPYGTSNGNVSIYTPLEVEITPVCDSYGLDWFVVVGIEEVNFVEAAIDGLAPLLASLLVIVVVETIILSLFAKSIGFSLGRMSKEMMSLISIKIHESKKNTCCEKFKNCMSKSTFLYDLREMDNSLNGLKQGILVFSKFVPQIVLNKIMIENSPYESLGLTTRDMSVLLVDFVDFTGLVSDIHTKDLLYLLEEYFSAVSSIVQQQHGAIDKFIGDGIVALFNEDSSLENHEIYACQAALQIRNKMEEITRQCGVPDTTIKIGLNCGSMLCGLIGSESRMNFSVSGTGFNIASKLKNLNKELGTQILLSEAMYEKIRKSFLCYFVDIISVDSVQVYVFNLEGVWELRTKHQDEVAAQLRLVQKATQNLDFVGAKRRLKGLLDAGYSFQAILHLYEHIDNFIVL